MIYRGTKCVIHFYVSDLLAVEVGGQKRHIVRVGCRCGWRGSWYQAVIKAMYWEQYRHEEEWQKCLALRDRR